MRFFKYSLIFVLCTCALSSALPAAKIRKSLKRSTEVPDALPKVEETGESKDSNRTKKAATTFCVEIKDGEKIEKPCVPNLPSEPQKVESPPEEPTFLVYQPPEQEPTISYVPIQIPIINQQPSSPQLIYKPGHSHQPHPNHLINDPCASGFPPGSWFPQGFGQGSSGSGSPSNFYPAMSGSGSHPGSGPGSNKPGSNSGKPTSGSNSPMIAPGSKPQDDCADGHRPDTVIMIPGGRPGSMFGPGGNIPHFPSMNGLGDNTPSFPSILPGQNRPDSPSTCVCSLGTGKPQVYAFMRNSMNEQDDMMMQGMDQRMAGMMLMDPMNTGMAPGTMDMRSAMMEPMTDASGMPRTHLHHYYHHQPAVLNVQPQPAVLNVQPQPAVLNVQPQPAVLNVQPQPAIFHVQPQPSVFNVQPQPVQYYQPVQLNQPCSYKLGLGGFRETSDALRAANNGNQGLMGPGASATGDMQSMGLMEMQRASQHTPQIVVTPANQASHLHPGQHAGNPCNEGKAKHWQIRSTDAGAEAQSSSTLEASADSPTKAQLTPSQMLNQMRAASPGQRISPIGQNDNDANVQMSVIGPGGQSYILGGGKSELNSEERREELSKREVEVSNNKLE